MGIQTWSPDHGVGLLVEDGYLLTRSGGASGGGGGSGGLAPGQGIQVGGGKILQIKEFAKASGTTAYAALDTVGADPAAVQDFPNAARVAGGGGYVVGVRLQTQVSTQTWRPRIHIFTAAPSALADNAPFTLLYANRLIRLCSVTLPALATEGTGSDSVEAFNFDIRVPYVCAATSLFTMTETLDAFTPITVQPITLELYLDRD